MPKTRTLDALPPGIGHRLVALATSARIPGYKPRRKWKKPHTHRLMDLIVCLRQTYYTWGRRHPVYAKEPLWAWSARLGLPIWHWIGSGWATTQTPLHPVAEAAFKRVLEQAQEWRAGRDYENMPCQYERLEEYVQANFQAAGFFSRVLVIVDELEHIDACN